MEAFWKHVVKTTFRPFVYDLHCLCLWRSPWAMNDTGNDNNSGNRQFWDISLVGKLYITVQTTVYKDNPRIAKGDLSRDSIERRQKTFWVVGRVRLPAIDNERSTFLFRVLLVVTLVEVNMCPFLLRFSFYSLIQPTKTQGCFPSPASRERWLRNCSDKKTKVF